MKFKLGKGQPLNPVLDAISAVWEKFPLGASVEVKGIKPTYTRQEEKALHLLLAEWIRLDPQLTVSVEQLKEDVCRAMYGIAKQVSFGGQESFIAARRTTRRWDFRSNEYVDEPLTVEEYAELIDYIYQLAAQDGIVLPELKKEKAA